MLLSARREYQWRGLIKLRKSNVFGPFRTAEQIVISRAWLEPDRAVDIEPAADEGADSSVVVQKFASFSPRGLQANF
jgi:hypothetical protein